MIQSAEEFIELLSSTDPKKYHRCRYDNATDEVWLEVIHKYPDKISWVILNKSVPISILHVLAASRDERVRADVAMKRKIDMDLFVLLANDENENVRMSIVNNQKAPREILELLVNDPSSIVSDAAQKRMSKLLI